MKKKADKKKPRPSKRHQKTDSVLLKRLGGRPPKYQNAAQLLKNASEYLRVCDEHGQLPEKAGLCLFLGISRDTYSTYRKDKKFSDAIKGIDNYIESSWVRRLAGNAATGAIFYLKNAFHETYKDRHEHDIDSSVTIKFDSAFQKKQTSRK